MLMNQWEIDEARERYADHPLLGPATATLTALRDAANACSDGWPYWRKPSNASQQLQRLIMGDSAQARYVRERIDVTPEKLRQAYAQLRRFRTTSGVGFHITGAPGVPGDTEPSQAAPEPENAGRLASWRVLPGDPDSASAADWPVEMTIQCQPRTASAPHEVTITVDAGTLRRMVARAESAPWE